MHWTTVVGSPVCEWVVPWLCCAAPPAACDRCQCTTQTSDTLYVNAANNQLPTTYTPLISQQRCLRVYGNLPGRQPLPHVWWFA
jgi:hypothetical protein